MRRSEPAYIDIRVLPNGREVYVYDEESLQDRKDHKDEKIATIKKQISRILKEVRSDIKDGSEPAVVVGVILCTYERVGNEASASTGHYGASNLEKRHARIVKDGIDLKYIAKSGVEQNKIVREPAVVEALKKRLSGKISTDKIFSCTPKQVNDYLKDKFDITSKDIRTFAANKFMADALVSEPIHETKTARNRVFNSKLKEVSEVIGHKPSTLKSMYLSDSLKRNYLESGKVKKLTGK